MSNRDTIPDWFLWLWGNPAIVLTVVPLVLLLIVFVPVWYVEGRLENIEQRLSYREPQPYVPPTADGSKSIDLSDYPLRLKYYVPCYSHIYHHGGRPLLLESTLSVRNTNPDSSFVVTSVKYYSTTGELVKEYAPKPIPVDPLATIEFLVEEHEEKGGSGANFLVEVALTPGTDQSAVSLDDLPNEDSSRVVIEAVMVGSSGTRSVAFARPAVLTDAVSATVENN
ncbi:DUF3124 domain-containing protein [Calycomorphotria hydatis]|uniref:Uncharacterized protein n=1 Tax=Calycomorphotria hydatis TaxID=2528027 RepID=A0A517T3A6_9PLAN|nr:DUF3124 domain-containing protein [Calycomorphotria hydatis]QDT62867.1 hypothetical protein V22_00650 [Calycomorphotria hydatis]